MSAKDLAVANDALTRANKRAQFWLDRCVEARDERDQLREEVERCTDRAVKLAGQRERAERRETLLRAEIAGWADIWRDADDTSHVLRGVAFILNDLLTERGAR